MKRTTLALTLLCAFGAFAYAGPEAIQSSSKEMKQVVPMATPCPTWTGFYIGGSVAYAEAQVQTHLDLTGTWEQFPEAERDLQDRGNHTFGESGAELGGLLGYNWQFGHWVIGAEAAGGYMFLRNSFSSEVLVEDPLFQGVADARISGSYKTHYLATFGGKFGYAMCRWLPYFTGGVALGDTDLDGQIAFQGDEGFRFRGSRSDTRTGWFVGGGLEYMLTNHWRVRGQYQYIDLGETGFSRMDNFNLGFESHRTVDLREHNAQFAIIYGF